MSNENKKSMGDDQSSKIAKAIWEEPCCICNQKTITKALLAEHPDGFADNWEGEGANDWDVYMKNRTSLNVCFSCFVSPDEEHEWDENGDYRNLRHRQAIWYAGSYDIEYPISEVIWDIEDLIKQLNQTKNEGRHEMRTIKDKENQKKLNQIRDEVVDCSFGNQSVDKFWNKIQEIVSDKVDIPSHDHQINKDPPKPNKAIENQKIVDAFMEIAKTGATSWTRGMIDVPKYNQEQVNELLKIITNKNTL